MAKDLHAAIPLIFAGKTGAKGRIATDLPPRERAFGWPDAYYPRIRFRFDGTGGEASEDNRVKAQRVVFEFYGPEKNGGPTAYGLYLEVEDVLRPPERVVHGLKGKFGEVYVSDVRLVSGPTWSPDGDTGEARYIASYRFVYL